MKQLERYLVGGAVRDQLLGRAAKDRDYVVIGETRDSMLARGFKPVGADFPVFLHPETGEEHALARTERKTGRAHAQFSTETAGVWLEQDLARRDLTINAMAVAADGRILDPFGGQRDLRDKTLRHVGPAFREDPLRVLRLARFSSQLDFAIAPETTALAHAMTEAGDLDALTAERVAQELLRALASPKPSRFFAALDHAGALQRLFPEIHALKGQTQPSAAHEEGDAYVHTLMVVDAAANNSRTRLGALCHDLGKGATPQDQLPRHIGHEQAGEPIARAFAERLKLPKALIEAAAAAARWHSHVHNAPLLTPSTFVKLHDSIGAHRGKAANLTMLAEVAEADYAGHINARTRANPQGGRDAAAIFLIAMNAIGAVRATDFATPDELARLNPIVIKAKLTEARVYAVRQALHGDPRRAAPPPASCLSR